MGEWMSEGGTGTPHYVVNPDHIARLQNEGYQIITDPRATTELKSDIEEPEKDEEAEDDDTTRRLTTAKPANKTSSRRMDTASG